MVSPSLSNPCSSQICNRLNNLFSPEINENAGSFFLCLVHLYKAILYYLYLSLSIFERKPENLTGLKDADL